MKNAFFVELIFLISIFSYLFFSSLFDWIDKGIFEITLKDIRDAIILGIFIPAAILVSRKYKNGFIFVFLVIALVGFAIFSLRFLFKI